MKLVGACLVFRCSSTLLGLITHTHRTHCILEHAHRVLDLNTRGRYNGLPNVFILGRRVSLSPRPVCPHGR